MPRKNSTAGTGSTNEWADSELEQRNRMMLWIAVVLSVLALAFAVASFVRADDQFQLNLQREWEQASTMTQRELSQLRAELRLERLQARVTENETIEDAQEQVAMLRRDMETAYMDLSTETENNLNQLETQLRDNSADALATIEQLLAETRRDIRTDNANQ